jgi:hypothetical protein
MIVHSIVCVRRVSRLPTEYVSSWKNTVSARLIDCIFKARADTRQLMRPTHANLPPPQRVVHLEPVRKKTNSQMQNTVSSMDERWCALSVVIIPRVSAACFAEMQQGAV